MNATPILKQFGKEQKYVLRQMAQQDLVIRVVIYHTPMCRDHIHLYDESRNEMKQIVWAELLQAMGRKGLFSQEVQIDGVNLSIVKFRLKDEVKNHFIN